MLVCYRYMSSYLYNILVSFIGLSREHLYSFIRCSCLLFDLEKKKIASVLAGIMMDFFLVIKILLII